MTSKLATQIKYTQVVRDIKVILERGRQEAMEAVQRQVIETNWEVGRYLARNLPLDEMPSAKNSRIVGHLASTFNQPKIYFYTVMKFYRCYPDLPPDDETLSWAHYKALLTVEDPDKREAYEQLAIEKNIPSRNLYGLILAKREHKENNSETAGPRAAILQTTRGQLYHYRVEAPKMDELKTCKATLDLGFSTFRDIAIGRQSKMHVGHIVYTNSVVLTGVKNLNDLKHHAKRRARYTLRDFTAKFARDGAENLYTYKANIERVIDGDTLVCMIDLGLKTKTRRKLRLRGINCPEMSTKSGAYVKERVKKILDKQKFIVVKTYKNDKYGRMLADVFYLAKEKDANVVAEKGIYFNQILLDEGLAEIW